LKVTIGAIMERISSEISVNDFDSNLFRNPDFEISEFAKDLGFPKSDVYFLFKYYCKISFVEFRTMVSINLANREIDNDYLQLNTMESLAVTVGFSSYNLFFNGFKKHIGISTKNTSFSRLKK
jgi:AraC-like DNA-binding protein